MIAGCAISALGLTFALSLLALVLFAMLLIGAGSLVYLLRTRRVSLSVVEREQSEVGESTGKSINWSTLLSMALFAGLAIALVVVFMQG